MSDVKLPALYLEVFNTEEVGGVSKKTGKDWKATKVEGCLVTSNGRRVVTSMIFHARDGSIPKIESNKKYVPQVSLNVDAKGNLKPFITGYKEI